MFGNYRALTTKEGLDWLKHGVPSAESLLLPRRARSFAFDIEFEETISRYRLRDEWVHKLSFAIPCREAMEAVSARPIIEVGAGSGYWAALVARHGGDIIATDIASGVSNYRHHIGAFHAVDQMAGEEAVRRYLDRDVLMVWPNYADPFAFRIAREIEGDRLLHYVGEGYGGCTGDDDFHELLAREFEMVGEVAIPQWEGIHDYLTTYRRKR